MEDKYAHLRALPFPVVAGVLGIDLSKFKTAKNGAEMRGPCPICRPKRNATGFNIHQDGRYQCFLCRSKGRGSLDLYKAVKDCGFQDAVAALEPLTAPIRAPDASNGSKPTSAPSPPQDPPETPTENRPFKSRYSKFFKWHIWLTERGIKPETLEFYGSGFYRNDTRRSIYNETLMLKIRRFSDGECVGWLSRNLDKITPEKPKYKFPQGLHKSLEVFGSYELKALAPIRVLYVVESPLAVMKFHQLGFPAVSTFGWHVSEQQEDIIARLCRGLVWLPDKDKHAEACAYVGVLARRVWTKIPELPVGVSDPEYLTAEQIRNFT